MLVKLNIGGYESVVQYPYQQPFMLSGQTFLFQHQLIPMIYFQPNSTNPTHPISIPFSLNSIKNEEPEDITDSVGE
jgi:hypothetical protein